jgi:hypothetical protein
MWSVVEKRDFTLSLPMNGAPDSLEATSKGRGILELGWDSLWMNHVEYRVHVSTLQEKGCKGVLRIFLETSHTKHGNRSSLISSTVHWLEMPRIDGFARNIASRNR